MMKFKLSVSSVLAVSLLLIVSCSKQSTNTNPGTNPDPATPVPGPADTITSGANNNMRLGNPTMAKPESAMNENYLINQVYYIESYSRNRGIPNWVSWHFQSEDKGTVGRQDDFRPFTGLPSGWYQVAGNSYSYATNGFDRGHNCPSGDRTSSYVANSSTFYMTNMIPQSPNLNQGPWSELEDQLRDNFVGTSNEAYIIMGSYGQGGLGRGKTDTAKTIDNGRVTVPKKVWKVAVILPKADGDDLMRITANTTILAVNMPNAENLYGTSDAERKAWRNYLTTVAEIEADAKLHGVELNLLSNVPEAVRTALKAKKYQ
ncbi:DNA/RNA non-specific endonuclease [Filimonas effusa]|uniref:DNA/RNA non-specific endonuclease n=1 Tax=Filimonas effusa TaxID=2508721 RepID=A0A4Q1D7P3_9BACT|nr:DNA/RNA non-specific endonuclease [Filimonas effusa]RXK85251.1 DNA/RNA non-specific endonuclease [Filimonas effusa]